MDYYDEIEVQCLLKDGMTCRYLAALKKIWDCGHETKCPHRILLKVKYDAEKAAAENAKYKLEYPD